MIFMGPQLIAQINIQLSEYLKNDGLVYISEAVGIHNKR
jgi:dihydroorotate dehydrogenase